MNGLFGTEEFINHHLEFQPILEILFQNTQYFTRRQIIEFLETQIEIWLRQRKKLPLFFITYPKKIGSEYYYYHLFRDKFPEHRLLNLKDTVQFPDEYEVVYPDDWVLTGIRTTDVLELWKPRLPGRVHWTLIMGLMSEKFRNSLSGITTYVGYPIQHSLRDLISHLDSELVEKFYLTFNDGYQTAYPVHLEYKISRSKGCFDSIYLRCRDIPNKDFMIEIEKIYQKEL